MAESGMSLVRETDEFIKTSQEAVEGAVNQIDVSVNLVNDMSPENNSLKKQKILIVDDDDTHLMMVEEVLKGEYDVSIAKSGKEALGLFYQGLVPKLILLDIVMPEMDGWVTYGRIRAISNLHDTLMAFFTASDDPKDIQLAQEMGAVDFIKKPYKADDLLNRVEKIIKR
jgi:CheY-like chemotaxis protein